MGITKSPDGFKPFYIKIDTKTEAEFLWHLLNNDLKICFSEYLKQEKLRKQCTKCERIWGKPLWKKYNNPNTSNAKGNFTGKTGRIPKFLG